MKRRECKAYGCSVQRRHHEDPETERGPQFVEVPDDYPDDRPVYCSMTCAMLDGKLKPEANKNGYLYSGGNRQDQNDKREG
jgi:hypothetical protein